MHQCPTAAHLRKNNCTKTKRDAHIAAPPATRPPPESDHRPTRLHLALSAHCRNAQTNIGMQPTKEYHRTVHTPLASARTSPVHRPPSRPLTAAPS